MQVCSKKELRQHFLSLRQGQASKVAARASAHIRKHLLELEVFERAGSVLMYLPTRGEVDTWPLIDHFWQQGVNVLLPRCRDHEPGTMDVHIVRSKDDLGPGHFGLIEPKLSRTVPVSDLCLEVILIPALAFDRQGFRLGYGGGYYDRFLARLSNHPLLIGLAHDFQVVDLLPREPWDQPIDMIVSPDGIIVTQRDKPL